MGGGAGPYTTISCRYKQKEECGGGGGGCKKERKREHRITKKATNQMFPVGRFIIITPNKNTHLSCVFLFSFFFHYIVMQNFLKSELLCTVSIRLPIIITLPIHIHSFYTTFFSLSFFIQRPSPNPSRKTVPLCPIIFELPQ